MRDGSPIKDLPDKGWIPAGRARTPRASRMDVQSGNQAVEPAEVKWHMVSSGRGRRPRRARLGFRQEALSEFTFLTTDYAFRCTHADPNLLTYESENLFVDVYRDPLTYEVGVDLGKFGDESNRKRSFTLVGNVILSSNPAGLLALPLVYSPECVEGRFSDVRRSLGVEGAPGLVVHYHRR